MKRRSGWALVLLSAFLIGCNNHRGFENRVLKINNLYGYRLDSVETGGTKTRVNGKRVDPPRAIVVNYTVSKEKTGNNNNYLRIRTLDLNEISGREYFEAELSGLSEYYPPFTIHDNVRDTTINSNEGHFYSITIDYNNQQVKQYRYILVSKSNQRYDITMNVLVNSDFDNAKNAFDAILSEMVLK